MTTIPEDELLAFGELIPNKDLRLLELGNKKNATGLYRHWYEGKVASYQCLDWNGHDGAVVWDMRVPVGLAFMTKLGAPFDIVTNFGFTEHVEGQWICWANVTWFVKVGGWLVFCMPTAPHWPRHGIWQPSVAWYAEYASRNGFYVEELQVFTSRKRPTIVGRFRRVNDVPFDMPRIPIKSTGDKDYAH